ncbi:MAG: SCP2 sterol-binding domain-containing protein [Pseudomonadota bacterium]
MSALVDAAADVLREKVSGGGFDGSVKFELNGEGVIRIADGEVHTDDADADCTISADPDVFKELFEGELDPTAAYMTGKIKIDGDMSVAMKLGSLLS